MDARDPNHAEAVRALRRLARDGLITHNYVMVESIALLQRRGGAAAALRLNDDVAPALDVLWIDEQTHRAGAKALRGGGRVSFVDRISFEVMREHGLTTAFAFDADFRAAGFELVPAQA